MAVSHLSKFCCLPLTARSLAPKTQVSEKYYYKDSCIVLCTFAKTTLSKKRDDKYRLYCLYEPQVMVLIPNNVNLLMSGISTERN